MESVRKAIVPHKSEFAAGDRGIVELEVELQRLHAELTLYGNFEDAPDTLLDRIALIWDEWTKAKARTG